MWQNQTPLIHARWIWFPHPVRFHISGKYNQRISALKSNWIERSTSSSRAHSKKCNDGCPELERRLPTSIAHLSKNQGKSLEKNWCRKEVCSLHIKSQHNCSFGQKHGFLRFGLLFLLGISNVYSSFLPTFIYLKCVHKCYLKPKRVELGNKLTSLKKTSVKLVSQVAD